jgi:stress-induced morphogen
MVIVPVFFRSLKQHLVNSTHALELRTSAEEEINHSW